jgi:hypothetical protein
VEVEGEGVSISAVMVPGVNRLKPKRRRVRGEGAGGRRVAYPGIREVEVPRPGCRVQERAFRCSGAIENYGVTGLGTTLRAARWAG